MQQNRIVIMTDNASLNMGGGEASRAYFCFKLMRSSGIDVWMVCHTRVRTELRDCLSADDFERVHFLPDTRLQKLLSRVRAWLPRNVKDLVITQLVRISGQRHARRQVSRLIAELDIKAVYEPAPNSPKGLSFMHGLGVPVIIGPMSGGITLPPAFRSIDSLASRIVVNTARKLTPLAHYIVPGKIKADALIVANKQTQRAPPNGCRGKVYQIIESGVDRTNWQPRNCHNVTRKGPVRFASSGRFVKWKGFQFLIKAFASVAKQTNATLDLVGDGEMRPKLEHQVKRLGLQDNVRFHGWANRNQSAQILSECDVYVQSSLSEAGGTAIIEALALGLPVVATNWGGPSEIINASCGILVNPDSHTLFVSGLSKAMLSLAENSETRQRMSQAAIKRSTEHYLDWQSKVDRIAEVIEETISNHGTASDHRTSEPASSETTTSG